MDIELGKTVMSRDGTRLGTVDRLVINPETWELDEVIVHQGFWFGEDRIVERFFIDHIDQDGTVYLNVTAADAVTRLPRFVEEAYLIPTPDVRSRIPASISTGGGDVSAILWRSLPRGAGFERPPRPVFETPAITEPQIELRSNLLAADVTIDRGTHVVGSDGRRLGDVADLVYDDGRISGIVVGTGIFTHDMVTIPAEWIQSVTHKQVRLKLPGDDALNTARRNESRPQEG